ncbi:MULTISPECIES: hypothetical protein [unclassified Wenzhouxiangella]|uniref:hypothetical protein n=1 Tax=unclassified Wenzhouxiangella TaxID=2613841 RepID=UPI0011C04C87|nr:MULTISPECIES: hypothetical protein [unclassified Wenzhouxiangella]
MRYGPTSVCLGFTLALLIFSVPAPAQPVPENVLALHWHPATADQARNRTLAAAAWLERGGEPSEWPQAVEAIALRLQPAIGRTGPVQVSLMDGLMAWLVRQREFNLGQSDASFPEPELAGVAELLEREQIAGELARMRVVAAYRAKGIWDRVAEVLGEEDRTSLTDYWRPLLEEFDGIGEAGAETAVSHAREQAGRVRDLSAVDATAERLPIRDAILRAEARQAWQAGRLLDSVWFTFEGLARLTQHDGSPSTMAAEWSDWLESIETGREEAVRLVDMDLPVILAMLGDAADYLASPDQATQSALVELADTYARLALFAPDLAFYLDQPVRERVRRVIANCNPDPLLVGPLPREVFERCARNLEEMLTSELVSEELVGEAQGPFAAEFLRREFGLVSWQRAAYLDGHFNWLLEAQCQPPGWVNVLEWSLLVDHLVRWVSQRPVFFTGGAWRDTVDGLAGQMRQQATANVEWIDCITGRGGRRRDPVIRLLTRHRAALGEVDRLISEARADFYEANTRPGADIDLDGTADQVTAYRPQGLTIGPCPEANTCGARVELPASRAVLGLFPNAFLLADQVGMGELRLCYDQVRWVERAMEPARRRASRVANYFGRLSFDLVGTFRSDEKDRTVFRYRLTDSETSHYLFAAESESILAQDCPVEQVGKAVASELPQGHPGLVPNRLTYFASTPTTPETKLLANWNQGAEWRDWFVTVRRVTEIETADPADMEVAVQARLAELRAQRERQLLAPLINPPQAGDESQLALAMARVVDTAALLRRVLELHYPRIIRQHAPVRAMLAGTQGLITRDRVRRLRDDGVVASRIPGLGLDRAERLRRAWMNLPESLREQGQRAPEIDYGLERLARLEREMTP